MNAASNSRTDFAEDNAGDSDSDTNSDELTDYYQPISSIDINENGDVNNLNINGYHDPHEPINQHNTLINGHDFTAAENGVRSLNLSEEEEEREDEVEEEEDEEGVGVELDTAMRRAIEEDESRRNAPLSSENAVRVMEAMRGVSFPGMPPDWVSDLPEDRWVHQLHRLRQPPHSTA